MPARRVALPLCLWTGVSALLFRQIGEERLRLLDRHVGLQRRRQRRLRRHFFRFVRSERHLTPTRSFAMPVFSPSVRADATAVS